MGTFNLEEYEEQKTGRKAMAWQLLVPAYIREEILMDNGSSAKDIRDVLKRVKRSQRQRRHSFESQDMERWHLVREFFQRRYRRWKTGVSKKRELELLWENANKIEEGQSC